MSSGGVFESRTGRELGSLNAGCAADFRPDPNPEYGHDPHCLRLHPLAPDILYQQNHCGIYRMERAAGTWIRIGASMPKKIATSVFLWCCIRATAYGLGVPMDGSSCGRAPARGSRAYVTRNAGKSWRRQDAGCRKPGWFTVKRQAMSADAHDPVGVYFGTTGGEVWASRNEGAKWTASRSTAHVYAVEAVELPR